MYLPENIPPVILGQGRHYRRSFTPSPSPIDWRNVISTAAGVITFAMLAASICTHRFNDAAILLAGLCLGPCVFWSLLRSGSTTRGPEGRR